MKQLKVNLNVSVAVSDEDSSNRKLCQLHTHIGGKRDNNEVV